MVVAGALAAPALGQADRTPPRVLTEALRTCILTHTCFRYVESNEDADLVATGRAILLGSGRSFPFKPIHRRVRAQEEYELSFALRRRAIRILRRALRDGRRVRAKEKVVVTDAAGNSRVLRGSVPIILAYATPEAPLRRAAADD